MNISQSNFSGSPRGLASLANNKDQMNESNLSKENILKNTNAKQFFVENDKIFNFSFQLIEKIDDLLSKSQFDQVDSFFKDFKQLSLFLNYFSGFLSFHEIESYRNQDIIVNTLSYLLFRNFDSLNSFVPLAINLMVGGPKKLFKPNKTQRMIALRYFLQYFNAKWFGIKYSDSEYFLISIFKNMSSIEDPGYYAFLNKIIETVPNNSRIISSFIEVLFNSPINSPLQFKFVNDLARKCPQNIPYYSVLFFIKHSINGIFTKISHHYLIPLILDFYNQNELLRLAIWHYLCRLVQFCITVQCLKKQQRMLNENKVASKKLIDLSLNQPRSSSLPISILIQSDLSSLNLRKDQFNNSPNSNVSLASYNKNNTDNDDKESSLSEDSTSNSSIQSNSSSSLIEDAFEELDSFSDIVNEIIDLLHILYALHIPLLCRTIYMEIRCAQISFNFFKKQKFDESYVALTVDEIQKAQCVELPSDIIKQLQNVKNISKSDIPTTLQRKKEIYYIQHYLYDKQLLKDFHGVRPREINLRKLLDFPVSGIPLKKGVEKPKVLPSNTKQSEKSKQLSCSSLGSSLYGTSLTKKTDIMKKIPPNPPQSEINRPSPMMRLRQYFSKESTSASAE